MTTSVVETQRELDELWQALDVRVLPEYLEATKKRARHALLLEFYYSDFQLKLRQLAQATSLPQLLGQRQSTRLLNNLHALILTRLNKKLLATLPDESSIFSSLRCAFDDGGASFLSFAKKLLEGHHCAQIKRRGSPLLVFQYLALKKAAKQRPDLLELIEILKASPVRPRHRRCIKERALLTGH